MSGLSGFFLRCALLAALVFLPCAAVYAQATDDSADNTPLDAQGGDVADQDQGEWTKDMDKKLDTTIEVLKVIKDELKEDEKEESVSSSLDADEEWDENVKSWAGKIGRMWRKIRQVTQEEDGTPVSVTKQAAEDQGPSLSDKMDKAISALQIIKEEMEKPQDDTGADTKDADAGQGS